jgi:hypothetical protein
MRQPRCPNGRTPGPPCGVPATSGYEGSVAGAVKGTRARFARVRFAKATEVAEGDPALIPLGERSESGRRPSAFRGDQFPRYGVFWAEYGPNIRVRGDEAPSRRAKPASRSVRPRVGDAVGTDCLCVGSCRGRSHRGLVAPRIFVADIAPKTSPILSDHPITTEGRFGHRLRRATKYTSHGETVPPSTSHRS